MTTFYIPQEAIDALNAIETLTVKDSVTARDLIPTASELYKLMGGKRTSDGLTQTAKAYLNSKIAAHLTGVSNTKTFVTDEMSWGIAHESQAIERLSNELGCVILDTGDNQQFHVLNRNGVDLLGATPDGATTTGRGVEVKCPRSDTHVSYLGMRNYKDLFDIKPEYFWQCVGGMACTDANGWYFASFDPRFKRVSQQIVIVPIERHNVEEEIEYVIKQCMVAYEYIQGKVK
jgi:hypothetical protein